MFKRYIKTAAGFLSLFFIYFLALSPILAVRRHLDSTQFAVALIIWGVLAGLFFIPAAAMIIRRSWFFRGSGEPVVLELLRAMLLEVNTMDAPVEVREQRRKITVTWRLHDKHWCERIEKTGMKRVYELWLYFDNSTKTVTMSDKYRSVNWDMSPIAVKKGWLVLSRPFFKVTTGSEWGIENYRDTSPESYSYSPEEIKSPVMNTMLKNGWNVRFSLL
jgi:hypothetical protein